MGDVFSQTNDGFNSLANKFVLYVAAHAAQVGLLPATATALTGGLQLWNDGYADDQTKAAAAKAATAVKQQVKTGLITLLRPAIQTIQSNPAVTNEVRQLLGLPIPDPTRTRAPVPTTRPVVSVEVLEHLQHVIHWRDEATPKSKAKPAGVRGAEIWAWIGPNPPADPAGFKWVALDSATPYLLVYEAADAGKTAYLALRWENTRGETGPWSDVVSATIPV